MIAKAYKSAGFIADLSVLRFNKNPFVRHATTASSIGFSRKDRTLVSEIFENPAQKGLVQVSGWVKSIRSACKGTLLFVDFTDSTTVDPLQVAVSNTIPNFDEIKSLTTGSSVSFIGEISTKPLELKINNDDLGHKFYIYNKIDSSSNYPIAKHALTLDYIRSFPHLRSRTKYCSSIFHLRSMLINLTHKYFNQKKFTFVNTPILTTMDTEGFGSQFGIKPTDFFGKNVYLAVSGQLALEALTCSIGDTYTLGPTFRAENSNTNRHLSEFWMLEVECSFANLNDIISLASDYIKYISKEIINTDWIKYIDKYNGNVINWLNKLINEEVLILSFDECMEIIKNKKSIDETKNREIGRDEEKILFEHFGDKLIAITHFPSEKRPFYMKRTIDGKNTISFDLIAPEVGEIIGGSERETSNKELELQLSKGGVDSKNYQKYLELNTLGSIPHSGFGLGIERLLMTIAKVKNIKDTIPFPRYIGHAEF